jgi:predicted NUDIX family NTP pyrophosphohydrolase
MPKRSAGLLLYRRSGDGVEMLIVHPGGPFWEKKDDGAWSVPKGEYDEGEDPWIVACREFAEEVGQPHPEGEPIDLGELRQPSGKRVRCFALEGDADITEVASNTFEMEWPPRSGNMQEFPEVDRAAWVSPDVARRKLLKGQAPFVDVLLAAITN